MLRLLFLTLLATLWYAQSNSIATPLVEATTPETTMTPEAREAFEARVATLKRMFLEPQADPDIPCVFVKVTPTATTQFNLLQNSNNDYAGSDASYTYKFHVCGVVTDPACKDAATGAIRGSLCQYQAPNTVRMIGSWTSAATWDLIDAANPGRGMYVSMVNGDTCFSAGKWLPRSLKITFQCQQGEPGGAYTVTNSPGTPCLYALNFPTQCACPSGCDSGPSSSSGGLSGGTIFLIILIVVIPVYIAAGCIYKRQRMGTVGCESCPNVDFWRDLPRLVKEGCVFTFTKIRSCCKGGSSSYENVPEPGTTDTKL